MLKFVLDNLINLKKTDANKITLNGKERHDAY